MNEALLHHHRDTASGGAAPLLRGLLGVAGMLLLATGCGSSGGGSTPSELTEPTLGTPIQVVPSATLPPEVVSQVAHNNLDVVDHEGATYFAFRTAPNHFASPDAVIYVLSSEDEADLDGHPWRFEARFALGTDLREPRFLSWKGRLFFYFSELGKRITDFEPKGVWMSERRGPGDWTQARRVYLDGFIAWRTRVLEGRPMIVGYLGGEGIYASGSSPLEVHWLTTDDGRNWMPWAGSDPVVSRGGGSETDLAVAPDGAYIAVIRNEEGDELGWGSKICRAEPADPGAWRCVGDPRKYDSPLVFSSGGRIWLIGRRNVTETGAYDLGKRDLSHDDQTTDYLLRYWGKPKRCALWEVDPEALTVRFALDLPSLGDTCFAGILSRGEGRFVIYDYTSPLDADPSMSWVEGQMGPTVIVRQEIQLPR